MATPPGRESQVQALKEKPNVENEYAVAWASYNKGDDDQMCADDADEETEGEPDEDEEAS